MIAGIRLQNFRSYKDDSFEFEPGVNIIVGPNASGKTNLLESIMFSCIGTSYRAKDIDLISHDKPWARLDTDSTDGNHRTIKLELESIKAKKTIEIDGGKNLRMPKSKSVPFVLFEPNHLQMFHGGPELRREFMDNLLSQINPEFARNKNHYKRALVQRNSLLKSGVSSKDQIFVWNIRLSDLAGAIVAERLRLVNEINDRIQSIYSNLSGIKSSVSIKYKSKCNADSYASSMLKALESSYDLDLVRGFTSSGPHRDDIDVILNDSNVKESASRGEIRTIVLAMKIIEQQILEDATGQAPLMLLDDVFSELDGHRRRALTEFLSGHQVFITTTDADVVIQHFTETCNVIALV